MSTINSSIPLNLQNTALKAQSPAFVSVGATSKADSVKFSAIHSLKFGEDASNENTETETTQSEPKTLWGEFKKPFPLIMTAAGVGVMGLGAVGSLASFGITGVIGGLAGLALIGGAVGLAWYNSSGTEAAAEGGDSDVRDGDGTNTTQAAKDLRITFGTKETALEYIEKEGKAIPYLRFTELLLLSMGLPNTEATRTKLAKALESHIPTKLSKANSELSKKDDKMDRSLLMARAIYNAKAVEIINDLMEVKPEIINGPILSDESAKAFGEFFENEEQLREYLNLGDGDGTPLITLKQFKDMVTGRNSDAEKKFDSMLKGLKPDNRFKPDYKANKEDDDDFKINFQTKAQEATIFKDLIEPWKDYLQAEGASVSFEQDDKLYGHLGRLPTIATLAPAVEEVVTSFTKGDKLPDLSTVISKPAVLLKDNGDNKEKADFAAYVKKHASDTDDGKPLYPTLAALAEADLSSLSKIQLPGAEAAALFEQFFIDRAIRIAMAPFQSEKGTYYGYQLATRVAPEPSLQLQFFKDAEISDPAAVMTHQEVKEKLTNYIYLKADIHGKK